MAVEILAHRILWSLVVTSIMLAVAGRTGLLRAIWTRREVRYPMMVAGVVIGLNWGTFIWGVTNGHVVDTSLGYYINPLVTVLLGVLVLKEHLRRWQWLALALAFVAVVVLSLEVGHPPWISLVLAFSFGIYGLIKKRVAVGPIEGLTFEGLVLVPVAGGYLLWIQHAGQSTAWSQGPGHVAMLAITGVLTALPLLCFAGAANRIPLTTLGLLQYIAPTVQLILGVALFDERMGVHRWVGFSLVWVALTIFTIDSLAAHRRRRGVARAEPADAAELEHSLPR
jgi:chloramphenicol-sensitive protein RarD